MFLATKIIDNKKKKNDIIFNPCRYGITYESLGPFFVSPSQKHLSKKITKPSRTASLLQLYNTHSERHEIIIFI